MGVLQFYEIIMAEFTVKLPLSELFPRGWRFLSVFTQFVLNEQTLRLLASCQGLANNCSPVCGLIYLFLVVLCKNLSYQVPGRVVFARYMLRQLH